MEKMKAELFFEYLRDILFEPEKAYLDLSQVPEEWKKLAQGMQFLEQCVKEQKQLGMSLAKGRLDATLPSPDNKMAEPLATIQSELKHFLWKMKGVVEGDYQQRLDFLGDFEDVFNEMVQIMERQRNTLEAYKGKVAQQSRELEQMQRLFLTLTSHLDERIVVLDKETGEEYFASKGIQILWTQDPYMAKAMRKGLLEYSDAANIGTETWEMKFSPNGRENRYHYVVTYQMTWKERPVLVHVIENTAHHQAKERDFQKIIFEDSLTGLYNRRYGMEEIKRKVQEQRAFCLAFVDMEYLKFCNDEFGQEEGDRYIIQVADLLNDIPGEKTVCRIGGDEFMILQEDISEEEFTEIIRQKRLELSKYPINEEETNYFRGFTYGIAYMPADGTKSEKEVLQEADNRLHHFKSFHKRNKSTQELSS